MLKRLTIIAIALAAIGCETPKHVIQGRRGVDAYLSGNFPAAIRTFTPLADKTNENYILNNLRLGAAAMAARDFEEAEAAYVKAYTLLNATKVNDAGREAATVWLGESRRVWRGEPYERAIANLQLGMIYYANRDWNNARGAFENALFKLRDYKDARAREWSEQESDFVVALLMLGRCWKQLGRDDQADAYFARVVQLRPHLAGSASAIADLKNNVVLYVEYGFGPRKTGDGMDGAKLAFYPRPYQIGEIPQPRVLLGGRAINLSGTDVPLFDTLSMALDRRWQKIDTIRSTKSMVGTGLMVAGAGATIYGGNRRDEGTALAGIGMLAAGALLKASSSVDTRVWEMSPRTAFVIPIHVPPGTHDLTVQFPDGQYQTLRGFEAPASPAEQTVILRMLRWTSGEYDWNPEGRTESTVSR